MATNTTKNRTLAVEGVKGPGDAERLEAALRSRLGVLTATVDPSKGRVSIQYDLRKVRLEDLEQIIVGAGYVPGRGFSAKLKSGFLRFTETNELDNLRAAPAPCCSDPVHPKDA